MHPPSLDDCYRLLELQPGATLEEIRVAYRLLSRVWHPDRFGGNAELQARATARQQALNAAYRRLVRAQRGDAEPQAPASPSRTPDTADSAKSADMAPTTATDAAASIPSGGADARVAPEPAHGGPQAPRGFLRGRVRVASTLTAAAIVLGVAALASAPDPAAVRIGGEPLHATAIAAGAGTACAASGQDVVCWAAADNLRDRAARTGRSVRLPSRVESLATGLVHTCALLEGGAVQCWGSNFAGQLGVGGLADSAVPADIAVDGETFTHVTTTGRHTCGLTAAGSLYCWGDDTDGQLGIGRPVARCEAGGARLHCSDRPERVGAAGQWVAVAAGGSHTCAIDRAGMVHCWGANRYGQLGGAAREFCGGPGGTAPCRRLPGPVALPHRATHIAAGASHTCVVDEKGAAWCWGLNAQGQSAVPGGDIVFQPHTVDLELRLRDILAGGYHTCATAGSSSLYCWGSDERGELRGMGGERCGTPPCAHHPALVTTGAAQAAAGFGVTCVIGGRGLVRCWGDGGGVASELRTSDSRRRPFRWHVRLREALLGTVRRVDDTIIRPLHHVL